MAARTASAPPPSVPPPSEKLAHTKANHCEYTLRSKVLDKKKQYGILTLSPRRGTGRSLTWKSHRQLRHLSLASHRLLRFAGSSSMPSAFGSRVASSTT